jgi:co-chaperonin GroES (HSP10)
MSHKQTKTKQPLQPASHYLLVTPVEPKQMSEGGIVLPDSHRTNTPYYQVIKLGDKISNCQIGDNIIISGGMHVIIDGNKYIIVKEDQILLSI